MQKFSKSTYNQQCMFNVPVVAVVHYKRRKWGWEIWLLRLVWCDYSFSDNQQCMFTLPLELPLYILRLIWQCISWNTLNLTNLSPLLHICFTKLRKNLSMRMLFQVWLNYSWVLQHWHGLLDINLSPLLNV
jgi:hypothetical protein